MPSFVDVKMEAGLNCVPGFIGRHEEREQIKEFLFTDSEILQVYGLPCVGKTELVRQVCREISSEIEAQIIYRGITNGKWPKIESHRLPQEDSNRNEVLFLIVLDCFEKLSEMEEFHEFSQQNLWNNSRLKMILVFQGLSPLRIDGFSSVQSIKVNPMTKEDARCLFYRNTKLLLDDRSDEQVDELTDICGGLPGQLIQLADKTLQFPCNTTLAEVFEFVKDNRDFCQSEDIFAKLDTCIRRLSPEQWHAFSDVVYFPGTFTLKDITEMTNYKNDLDAKMRFLYPLLNYGLLKSTDETNVEFKVPCLFQDYANQQLTYLRHEDTTKLKYTNIIGKTLIEAESIWHSGLTYEALGIMKNNWANIQKLLQQAIHSPSDGNSFNIYYKIVLNASNVIFLCYPNEARLFCKAVSDSAKIFGTNEQQALTMASYGHTIVESSVKEALQLYKCAKGVLKKSNHPYQFITILYHMSKAYYQRGKLQKGISCAKEALSIPVTNKTANEVKHAKTYALSYLAYNLIFATEYEEAEKILQQTLQEMGETGHPSVPTLLNSLGLKEERSNGDLNKALTFYFSSLSKKRKIAKFQEHLLVPTLCNVAGQLSKIKLKHDFALRFLYEAEEIQRRAGMVPAYSGLIAWNIGMVFMRKRMHVEAVEKIREAETLYEAANRNHYANAEVKLWLAHCHLLLNNPQQAKQLFWEIVQNKDVYCRYRPQGEFVFNSLEHLIHLSIQEPEEQQTYIEMILQELPRLKQAPGVSIISLNKYRQLLLKYVEIYRKIINDKDKLESRPGVYLGCVPDTCLTCEEVLIYDMCPKDIYLQKMSMLTPTCQSLDKTFVKTRKELQKQTQNHLGYRNSGYLATDGALTMRQSNGNFSKEEASFNSNVLPLPVKEFYKEEQKSESAVWYQKELPDFGALSLEDNPSDCENNRARHKLKTQSQIQEKSTLEPMNKNGGVECYSFLERDRNGNILENNQFLHATRIQQQQSEKQEEYSTDLDKNLNGNSLGDPKITNGIVTNQLYLNSQRAFEEQQIKYIPSSKRILNTEEEENRFQKTNPNFQKLGSTSLPFSSASSYNSDILLTSKGQKSDEQEQRLIPNHQQGITDLEHSRRDDRDLENYFQSRNKLKNQLTSSSEINNSKDFVSKSGFSKNRFDLNFLNSSPLHWMKQSLSSVEGNSRMNIAKTGVNMLGHKMPRNVAFQKRSYFISNREPVEHEEKLD